MLKKYAKRHSALFIITILLSITTATLVVIKSTMIQNLGIVLFNTIFGITALTTFTLLNPMTAMIGADVADILSGKE